MLPIIQLGSLAIQVPGLALLVSLWIGLSLAEREARRLKLNADAIYNLAITSLIAGVIGARLAYVARYPGAYLRDPLGLFSLSPSALAPVDGMLIGLLAAWVYGARRKLHLRPTLDALAPALAVLLVGVALAHIASGDAFGAPARLPWSVYLWDEYRHPSQFYELIGSLLVLAAWGWSRGREWFAGGGFLFVAGLSAAAAIFLEAFRGDSQITFVGLRTTQLAGVAVLGACLFLARRWCQGAGAAESASV